MKDESSKASVDDVMLFAAKWHANQKWGDLPYTEHLSRVADKVLFWAKHFNLDEQLSDLTKAAWLHDVLEDTDVSSDDVVKIAGKTATEIVLAVTDEPGRNRKEKKKNTYPKIKANPSAVFIKLCDRLVNIENSVNNEASSKYLGMYKKEHPEFEEALRSPGQYDLLWDEINRLLKR